MDQAVKSAHAKIPGLREFLADYPLMAFRPRAGKTPVVKGRFRFAATHAIAGEVEDEFDLEIDIPAHFSREVPTVIETGGRIPRIADYHVNKSDGTLCLGSPLRLLALLSQSPSLTGFVNKCLIPYLFAISKKLNNNQPLPFGELAHGLPGMLNDYVALFGLKKYDQAVDALRLLGMKKRKANKRQCPCGCRTRLGICRFNAKIREFRSVASRPWFRSEYQTILDIVEVFSRTCEQL